MQARWLKFVKDTKANDLEKFFQKMQKFRHCLFLTLGRITLEFNISKLIILTFYLFQIFFVKLCTFERGGGTGPPNPPLAVPVAQILAMTNQLHILIPY